MRAQESLFVPHGDLVVATEAAGNPWGPYTGGGPVSGLLARAAEAEIDDPEFFVARLTVDLMRPVPRVPLAVRSRTVREGKRLRVVECALIAENTELARVTAQALRRTEMSEVASELPVTPLDGPASIADGSLLPPELELTWGVHDIIDVRWLSNQIGGSPSSAWMRMPMPLLPGETLSPLQHVAILADAISAAAPVRSPYGPWINTDLTVYLHRELTSEWLGMSVERDVQTTGVGVAHAKLYDEHGPIGVANEAVLANQLG